jgi:hypothetical protein
MSDPSNDLKAGFFESLRTEMDLVKSIGEDESDVHITIVCPPTVATNLRRNSMTTDPAFNAINDKGALSPAVRHDTAWRACWFFCLYVANNKFTINFCGC